MIAEAIKREKLESFRQEKLKQQKQEELMKSNQQGQQLLQLQEEIKKKEDKIKEMELESEKLNNPSTFAKFSKMQRQIQAQKQQIEDDQKKLAQVEIQFQSEQNQITLNKNNNNEDSQQPESQEESDPLKQHLEFKKQDLNNKIDKLDMKTTSGKLQNILTIMPVILYFVYNQFFPKLVLQINGHYFSPIAEIIGTIKDDQSFELGTFCWVMIVQRTVSYVNKLISM